MIELSEIRGQLRIDADEVDDAQLIRWRGAAIRLIEGRTNRKIYPPGVPLPEDAPPNALVMDDDVVLAVLLLIGHWDSHRADSASADVRSIPMGAAALVDQHRWFFD